MRPQRLPPQTRPVPEPEVQHRAQANVRIVFWICTLILLAGTHYPKLVIGTPGDSPDKLVHLFVFSGWGLLLWTTGYVRTPVLVFIAVAIFGLFDEWTQSIPLIGRSFDPGDLIADATAGIVVASWMLALRPSGVETSAVRTHEERLTSAGWRLLSRPLNLAHLVVGGALGAVLGAIGLVLVVAGNSTAGPLTSGVLGFFLGGYLGLALAFCLGRRRMMLPMVDPEAVKGSCGAGILTATRLALFWLIVVVLIVGLLWWGGIRGFPDWPAADWVMNHRERVDVSLAMAIEVAVAVVLLAFVARRTRVGLARRAG